MTDSTTPTQPTPAQVLAALACFLEADHQTEAAYRVQPTEGSLAEFGRAMRLRDGFLADLLGFDHAHVSQLAAQQAQAEAESKETLSTVAESATDQESLQVRWRPRGVGYGGGKGYEDLKTGERDLTGPDMSGFVRTKAEGHLACAIFGGRAYLDFRDWEPNWIQVKVMCADKAVLYELERLVRANDSILTPAIVALAQAAAE